jgi:outer membrane lipoprotein-sorting protein
MSDLHDSESEFLRLLKDAPFDDSSRPSHRDSLREQALSQFDRSGRPASTIVRWRRAYDTGRNFMRRPVPRLIAFTIASAVITTLWLFIPGQQPTALGFNRLAEAVITARTARFHMEVTTEGQPKQSFDAYYLAPGKFRQDLGKTFNITDLQAGQFVTVIPDEKKMLVMKVSGDPGQQQSSNYFERLRELLAEKKNSKDAEYERLGEKEMDGRQVVGFRFATAAATVTLWGDPKTGLPVRIENAWRGLPAAQVAMTDFEINVELNEKLFDMRPPEGYTVQTFEFDGSKPTEKDLIESLKACTELTDGEFPPSLDMQGITALMLKVTMKAKGEKNAISDEAFQRLMKKSITIGRGIGYATQLPESADVWYAGKGVKRGEKNRPVLWYRLEGKGKYRVVDAELSVQEMEKAPEVKDAQAIGKGPPSKDSDSGK